MTRHGDKLSVALFSLTAFLLVLALLGSQLNSGADLGTPRAAVLVRKIYRTTVVERVIGARPGPSGTSVSQTVNAAGGYTASPVVATRTS